MAQLEGVCTPVCTIFTEDGSRIDETAQKRHLDTLLEAGIHIICVCGGTGEFSFLTPAERRSLTELVCSHVDGQAKIIAHVSAVMTGETIEYAKHAEGLGADCLLVLPPYFEGPTLAGTYEHYENVAAAVLLLELLPSRFRASRAVCACVSRGEWRVATGTCPIQKRISDEALLLKH